MRKKNYKDVLYWFQNVMNRYKIGLNMYLILLIIKYIIYNEFVFVISFFILCDLCYGCNFFFEVVIC